MAFTSLKLFEGNQIKALKAGGKMRITFCGNVIFFNLNIFGEILRLKFQHSVGKLSKLIYISQGKVKCNSACL